MRFSDLLGPAAVEVSTFILALVLPTVGAVSFTPVPSPNLDLSGLGRVALTGDFDSISLYTYQGQSEDAFNTNGSQSLLTQLPNGAFTSLFSSDAYILAMCPYVLKNNTLAGIVLGGNFTRLGDSQVQGAALFNPNTSSITPLSGLTGSVNALLCDQETSSVYVGGDFQGANSTNAVVWVGGQWTNMPFQGFNGPVNAIAKAPDGNIIFGGNFTGLGNTTAPTLKDQQVINLSTANISTSSSTSTSGFSDPKNVVCKFDGQDGAGNTWLMEDNTPGFWQADLNFGFRPTKLRIWNTHQDGRGAKTFRFTALPINGILNLTYADGNSGRNLTCDATCPLSNDPMIKYEDFHFVNVIGMNSFRIDVSDWYGKGGGLDGIEIFQDDIYAYAVSALNEPACVADTLLSNSTTTGTWTVTPSGLSSAEYLTANLTGPNVDSTSASVTFLPDIKQSGNYTITIYTPGCSQDNSCASRGISNITGTFSSGQDPIQKSIFQTNDFEKYDTIYSGYVDANSDSFRTSITLSPLDTQNSSISLVALRVRFVLQNPSNSGVNGTGLNGLFEYNPNKATIDTDFSNSKVDVAGTALKAGADITSLSVIDQSTYVAGNFATNEFSNIFAMTNGNNSSLPSGGLNGPVASALIFGSLLFVGGNFTDTAMAKTSGLQHVAIFDTAANSWSPLGGGVNGPVTNIVPLVLNVTADTPETCVTVNGPFSQVLADGSAPPFNATGLAIWVPSRKQWINNLNIQTPAIKGQLITAVNVTDSPPLLAGTVSSEGFAFGDTAALSASSGTPSLSSLGIQIQPQSSGSSGMQKRAIGTQNVTGVVTGLFDTDSDRNLTIIAGHFTAKGTDGSTIENLAIANTTGDGKQTVTGLAKGIDSSSIFLALARTGDTLYAGGMVAGNVESTDINGLVVWDLASSTFNSSLPPALTGDNVAVNAISIRPSSTDLYVAGNFQGSGQIGCDGLCIFSDGRWNSPGRTFAGSVSATLWQGNDQLLVAGNLTLSNNQTYLATWDASKQTWSVPNGAPAVPGPVTVLSPASSDGSLYWIAGVATDGKSFIMKYDGSDFTRTQDLADQSAVRGLSVLSLTQDHDSNNFLDSSMALLVTGDLKLANFGNASAALYDGNSYTPFILANSGNGPGSLAQVVTEQLQSFNDDTGHLKLAYVVLIGLAIALAVIFLMIALGLFIERRRRRREGYRPAPQNYFEKTANMGRIPPEHLFGNLSAPRGPRV